MTTLMSLPHQTRLIIMAQAETDAIRLVTRDLPSPHPGEAAIRIRYAGICGTDLHLINWNDWAARTYRPPFALGHEFCGEVLKINGDSHLSVGDRVTAETHLPCGYCQQCRTDRGHTCDHLTTFSKLDRGAFADYAVVPVKLLRRIPDTVSDRVGAIMEPLGISVRAARELGSEGRDILVSGCGPVGLMAIAAARYFGARTIAAADPSPERRGLAETMGADLTIDPAAEPVASRLRDETHGGVDLCIETAGVEPAITAGLQSIKRGGAMLMAGLPQAPIPIDVTSHIVLREIALHGIYGRRLDRTWTDMERALAAGLNIDPVITDVFQLEDFEQAITCARCARAGKVLLRP